jgi:hypothetical protein
MDGVAAGAAIDQIDRLITASEGFPGLGGVDEDQRFCGKVRICCPLRRNHTDAAKASIDSEHRRSGQSCPSQRSAEPTVKTGASGPADSAGAGGAIKVIPDVRLSPACSARATAQRGQRRAADLIPDWLTFSTTLTLHRTAVGCSSSVMRWCSSLPSGDRMPLPPHGGSLLRIGQRGEHVARIFAARALPGARGRLRSHVTAYEALGGVWILRLLNQRCRGLPGVRRATGNSTAAPHPRRAGQLPGPRRTATPRCAPARGRVRCPTRPRPTGWRA